MNANKHRSCSIHCQMPTHHSTHDTNCIWVQITIQRSSPSDTRYIDCDTEQKEEEGYNRHELQSSYHCMSSCACGTNEKKNFHFQEVIFPFTYHGIQRRRRSSGLRNHRMRYITSGAVYGDRKRRCECGYITVAG